MISLILNKNNIPYFVITGLIIYILMIGKTEEKEIVIPSKENSTKIEDPKPIIEYDTIYKDSIVRKEIVKIEKVKNPINEELLQKYNEAVKANDSLKQLEIFKDAIKERKYIEKLKDTVQTITVESLVIGTLKSQTISYKTNPLTIKYKTDKTKPVLYFGGFVSVPTINEEFMTSAYGVELQLVGKKKTFSVGYDNKKNIQLTIATKLF